MAPTTIPILASADFDVTASFFAQFGFVERGRWTREYLILLQPDGIELHFWFAEHLDPRCNDTACFVRFATVAECRAEHDAWSAVGELPPADSRAIPRLHAPAEQADGSIEWDVIDPHGNLIRLGGFSG